MERCSKTGSSYSPQASTSSPSEGGGCIPPDFGDLNRIEDNIDEDGSSGNLDCIEDQDNEHIQEVQESLSDSHECRSGTVSDVPSHHDRTKDKIVSVQSPSGFLLGEIQCGVLRSITGSCNEHANKSETSKSSPTSEMYDEDFEQESTASDANPEQPQPTEKCNTVHDQDLDQR